MAVPIQKPANEEKAVAPKQLPFAISLDVALAASQVQRTLRNTDHMPASSCTNPP